MMAVVPPIGEVRRLEANFPGAKRDPVPMEKRVLR
jgi:hypothetical protein